MVLVPGWPLSAESWSAQLPALHNAGYRVVSYDRRGFGRSDKPLVGYSYDTLTDDLHALITGLDLNAVTIVGFSIGGGEVARYFSRYGSERLHSVVLASSVTPYLLQTGDNPDGPLTKGDVARSAAAFFNDQGAFYDEQMTEFFSADGDLAVSEAQRRQALGWCRQASKEASLACFMAWGATDFRADLARVAVPSLVLHGDVDASVPFDGSAQRTHDAVAGSELCVIPGGPHGCKISHADEFNRALLDFLASAGPG